MSNSNRFRVTMVDGSTDIVQVKVDPARVAAYGDDFKATYRAADAARALYPDNKFGVEIDTVEIDRGDFWDIVWQKPTDEEIAADRERVQRKRALATLPDSIVFDEKVRPFKSAKNRWKPKRTTKPPIDMRDRVYVLASR